jgi:hypothetical protein
METVPLQEHEQNDQASERGGEDPALFSHQHPRFKA